MTNYRLNGFANELEKKASMAGLDKLEKILHDIWPTLLVATGIGAGFEGVKLTAEAMKNKKLQNEVNTTFNVIMKDPELIKSMDNDPKVTKETIKGTFNVLAKFAPSLAATPEIARPFVRNAILTQGGMVGLDTVKTLAETNARHTEAPKGADISDRLFGRSATFLGNINKING